MNKNTYINEEHIVAFLDGEMQIGSEIKAAMKADTDLAAVALEHRILQRVFRSSAHDSRFQLSAEVDTQTQAVLREALRTSRNEVRLPQRAADAMPIRTPRIPAVKQLWFRRSAIGFAFALLLGTIVILTNTKDVIHTPEVAIQTPTTSPVNAPQTTVDVVKPESQLPVQSEKPIATTATKNVNGTANSSANANASRSEQPKNIAATITTPTESAHDPADIMISRRFAKLLKETPVVEVTQQDRM